MKLAGAAAVLVLLGLAWGLGVDFADRRTRRRIDMWQWPPR
jgi:hypothetical protein